LRSDLVCPRQTDVVIATPEEEELNIRPFGFSAEPCFV
jgi:hypothetical protein